MSFYQTTSQALCAASGDQLRRLGSGERPKHLGRWYGFAKQEALAVMRAVLKGRRRLRLGFDALGRDGQIEAFAEADNGAHENFRFLRR